MSSSGSISRRARRGLAALVVVCAFVGAAPLAAQSTALSDTATADRGAMLRPGDVLRLRIWREPDLSGEFGVDERGMVVFPKLGARAVTSITADSLTAELVRDYAVYLRNPSIEITVLRRVNVLGAVKMPGIYPADPTMTVGDVLALAGGVTPQGRGDRVEHYRNGVRVSPPLAERVSLADTPIRSGDQIFVPERSWLSRNPGILAAVIGATVSLVIALSR